MIYKYSLFGKLHNSDRTISYSASIPLGLAMEDLLERVKSFSTAFDLIKLEVN
jgi:hypothetical protein